MARGWAGASKSCPAPRAGSVSRFGLKPEHGAGRTLGAERRGRGLGPPRPHDPDDAWHPSARRGHPSAGATAAGHAADRQRARAAVTGPPTAAVTGVPLTGAGARGQGGERRGRKTCACGDGLETSREKHLYI